MTEKQAIEITSLLDGPMVPWLIVGGMLMTGFLAACLIVFRLG